MPLYYFDLSDGSRERDNTGTDLIDNSSAQEEAIRFLGEVLKHEPQRLDDGTLNVDLSDDMHRLLCTISVTIQKTQYV